MMKSATQSLPDVTFDPLDANAITVTVQEAPPGYKYILGTARYEREQIVVHPRFLKRTGIPRRSQLRLTSTSSGYEALFTIAQADSAVGDEFTFFCGPDAYDKLGIAAGTFTATLDTTIVQGTSDAQAQTAGDMFEVLTDDGSQSGLVILSYHGGGMEAFTTAMGQRMYDQLDGLGQNPSLYYVNGYAEAGYPDSAFNKWHITSTDIYSPNWPVLNTIIDRDFDHAVSFHGFTATNSVEVGGSASNGFIDTIVGIIDAAVGAEVTVSNTVLDHIQGASERNIMNRLSPNLSTIQVEMSYDVRSTYANAIADALAAYYNSSVL